MKKKKVIKINYKPREWQKEMHRLAASKRYIILNFHRRAGKTFWGAAEILYKLVNFNEVDKHSGEPLRNPSGALFASTIGQAERAIWEALKFMLKDIPDVQFNITKHQVSFPHPNPAHGKCFITLFGTQEFDQIRGGALDIAIIDEYAILHPDVYNKIVVPMLADRPNSKLIVISTPQGTNSFYKLYKVAESKPDTWLAATRNVYDTGIFDDEQLELIKSTVTEDAWKQEFECDWHAIPEGYYFAKEMTELEESGGIGEYPHDPNFLTHVSFDLGVDDATSLCFFQKRQGTMVYVDYYENRSKGLDHYMQIIKEKGYNIGKLFLPHDVMVKDMGSGRERIHYIHEGGFRDTVVVPKTNNLNEVIHLTRQYLPTVKIDEKKCARLIDCLKSYQRKYDPKTDTFGDKPLKNFATHGVDSFRTYVQVHGMGYLNENFQHQEDMYFNSNESFDPFGGINGGFTNADGNESRDNTGRKFFNQYRKRNPRILH